MRFLHKIIHSLSNDCQTGKDGWVQLGNRIYSGQYLYLALNVQESSLCLCFPQWLHLGNHKQNHFDTFSITSHRNKQGKKPGP
jgi:hypothetical protein